MILQVAEAKEASTILPDSVPILDHIQTQSDAHLASVVERVEHLIVMCNQVSPPENN